MLIWVLVLQAMAASSAPPGLVDDFRDQFNRPLVAPGSGARKAVKPAVSPNPPAPAAPSRCPPDMVYIQGGRFGSKEVRRFCLDKHEVTVEDFERYVKKLEAAVADSGTAPGQPKSRTRAELEALKRSLNQVSWPEVDTPGAAEEKKRYSRTCTWPRREALPRHPINCISVDEAEAFCQAQEKRLPSGQEWQWAARGGKRAHRYPGGVPASPERLNMPRAADDYYNQLRPVGTYPASASGLHDMAGNAWEWTACARGEARCASRGGGFRTYDESRIRAAFADTDHTHEDRRDEVGFRCAAPALKKGEGA